MFNSTSLPTEKNKFDWYGSGPCRSDSRTLYTHENFNLYILNSNPLRPRSIPAIKLDLFSS